MENPVIIFLLPVTLRGDFEMKNFAMRFKQLRNEKGLTQEELRADFNSRYSRNYTAAAISRYENGKRMPEIDALYDFAEYFGVCISYLLGETDVRNPDEGSSKAKPKIADIIANRDEKALDTFLELSPEARKKAAEYINMLKTLQDVKDGKSNENVIDFKGKA